MFVYEKELVEQANAELLRQIEEGLARSRKFIDQINEAVVQRQANLRRVGAGGFESLV